MKKLAIVIFLCLIFAKVVFPADIPRETIQCIKHLARDEYDSFAKLCADTVLFGQAFTGNCVKMTRRELIRFFERNGLSRENRNLFRRFPKGFKTVWDKEKDEIVCYRFSKPPAWLTFRKERKIWKLKVLGIHFLEEEEE